MAELRETHETPDFPMPISSQIGPRGDGYSIEGKVSIEKARAYHSLQANLFAETEADMITTMTMSCAEEAIGIALAAKDAGMPLLLSFTMETDSPASCGWHRVATHRAWQIPFSAALE